jgi:hypothetical protein
MRTRNALRAIGCNTVEDVLRLDLSGPIRGLGRKTKHELLTTLKEAGFHHPALETEPADEMQVLDRSLARIEGRVASTLEAVTKEIRLLRQKLGRSRRA